MKMNQKGYKLRSINKGFVYLRDDSKRCGRITGISKGGKAVYINFDYSEHIGYSTGGWYSWKQVMADRFREH